MAKTNKTIYRLLLHTRHSQYGYTLLESLVALVVVGILITSVAPLLALTTASRVQARRVDQASQALRAYIDGVRGGALPAPQKFVIASPNTNFVTPNYGALPNATMISTPDAGTLVDTNGNGFSTLDPQDLVIQAIRPVATCTSAVPASGSVAAVPAVFCPRSNATEIDAENALANTQGYLLVVRVYRADAFANGAVPDGTEQSGVFIGSAGSPRNPLISTFAEVYSAGTLSSIKQRDNTALP